MARPTQALVGFATNQCTSDGLMALSLERQGCRILQHMLTVPEVAAKLGRDPETVRRWIRSGRLRARKVGTQHVVEEEDLKSLFKGDVLPLPAGWKKTSTGETMPNVVHAVRRSRAGR